MEPTLAAEFPNDNPALHRGVTWTCALPCGPATADRSAILVVTPLANAPDPEPTAPPEPSENPPPDESGAFLVVGASSAPPGPADPFTSLVCTLADVAIGEGAAHVAALLPRLLLDGRIDEAPSDVAEVLRDAGIAEGHGVSAGFAAITAAWRAILRGTSDDFGACGGAMLDEWAADLLARLLGAPARSGDLRRELRSRGIAAFGLAA